jgi:glycerol-3-phosphate dehydrogenase
LIDHSHEHQVDGLITLIGVRATTARGVAEKAIDLATKKTGKKFVKSTTREKPIYGGDFEDFGKLLQEANSKTNNLFSSDVIQALMHNYGTKYDEVLKYVQEDPSWADTVEDTLTIKAEIIHAVREEMAIKLGDVIFRRTDIGTGEYPSENTARVSAEIMGSQMGWDENQIQREIDELRNCLFFKKQN